MDGSNFDATGFIQFNLERGSISCVKDQPVALVPLEMLTALTPGSELTRMATEFGRLHGEKLRGTLAAPIGVEALVDHLGGTAAALGMGRLGLEIHGDALTFKVQLESEAAHSEGYQLWICGFLAGYLSALTENDFETLSLDIDGSEQWYFAGNPQAVAQIRIWLKQGTEPLQAINRLARGDA
jgi:hypothetical protein